MKSSVLAGFKKYTPQYWKSDIVEDDTELIIRSLGTPISLKAKLFLLFGGALAQVFFYFTTELFEFIWLCA